MIKLDIAGNFIWADRFGGPGEDLGGDVEIDALGYVYNDIFEVNENNNLAHSAEDCI